jgi:IS30 family transposase
MKDKSARSMRRALEKALRRLPRRLRRTLTYDNGLENVLHELTSKQPPPKVVALMGRPL